MKYPTAVFRKHHHDSAKFPSILFSIIIFVVVAISVIFFILSATKPIMGVYLSLNKQGWIVQISDTNGIASRVGIKTGERPIEINGQPAQEFLNKYENIGAVFGNLINQVTVVNSSGQLASASLAGSFPSWQSVFDVLIWFLVSLICWITGFFVLLKKPQNQAALLLCLCALDFGLAFSANAAAERSIPYAVQIAVVALAISPWLLLHFFMALPEERSSLRKNLWVLLIYLPPAITLVLFPIIGFANGQPLPGFRNFRLIELGLGFLAVVIVALLNYVRGASPRTRQQMKIVLFSCLLALVPFLILTLLPQTIVGRTILRPGLATLFVAFIPLGLGYAVMTQKLMDIDILIRRGVIYGLITVVMAAILSGAIALALAIQKSIGTFEQIIIALVLGAVATLVFGPLKNGVETLVDKVLYKDRYDYRKIIHQFSSSLNPLNEVVEVSRVIVATAVDTLNLSGACLITLSESGYYHVIAAEGSFLDQNLQNQLLLLRPKITPQLQFPNTSTSAIAEVAYLVPLVAGEKETGLLCLSQKGSRQDFSNDDTYLIQGMASVAGPSLRSAMLVRDVSARDTFVSVASHELRTPLTSIMGYSELMTRLNPTEEKRKLWAKNIHANSLIISEMVDDLLNVSRIRSGRVDMKLEDVHLKDIVDNLLPMLRESTDRHEFLVDLPLDIPLILVDRTKFGQVLGNLLNNAVKYSPNGGPITISASQEKELRRVVVKVTDLGLGIGEADRSSLFTTFHRIYRPETTAVRGFGLGLYIVKEWTEQMGGSVWLQSELNKGSTFFVAVPIAGSKPGPSLPIV